MIWSRAPTEILKWGVDENWRFPFLEIEDLKGVQPEDMAVILDGIADIVLHLKSAHGFSNMEILRNINYTAALPIRLLLHYYCITNKILHKIHMFSLYSISHSEFHTTNYIRGGGNHFIINLLISQTPIVILKKF